MNGDTVVKVWIPFHPKGGNWRKRAHWRSIRREDDQWKNTAYVCGLKSANLYKSAKLPFGQCIVTVTYIYPKRRRRDWDNMAGELKGIFDGLTGVIWADDSTDCIVELKQRILMQSARDGLLIEVEPLQQSLL